jgi:hypothetical protein
MPEISPRAEGGFLLQRHLTKDLLNLVMHFGILPALTTPPLELGRKIRFTLRPAPARVFYSILRFDPAWALHSKVGANPMIWFLDVNGLIVDIRHMLREAQAVAFEKGLIPSG